MQFLIALVEHLIVGVFALLWALPVADAFSLIPKLDLEHSKELLIAIGAPVIYVLGMYVDVVASPIASSIKILINRKCANWRKHFFGASLSNNGEPSYKRTALIMSKSPDELAKYFLQLAGREKIARGVFLNFFLAAIANAFISQSSYKLPVAFLLITGVVGVLVWLRLNALNDTFKSHW